MIKLILNVKVVSIIFKYLIDNILICYNELMPYNIICIVEDNHLNQYI